MVKHTSLVLLSLLLLAGCGESTARKQARHLARRNSCVASELALDAKERLASLDTAVARAQGTAMEQVTQASWQFASAYKRWADAVSQAAALDDSAANARSKADSARLAGEARRARPALQAPGSVGANAAARYDEDVTRALGNPDHPCNHPERSE